MQINPSRPRFRPWPAFGSFSLDAAVRDLSPAAVIWLADALLTLPLLVRLYGGSMARWAGDDWCWATFLRRGEPLLGHQSYLSLQAQYYQHDFGRFASTALLSGVGLLGPWSAPVLAVAGLMLLIAASTWCAYELTHQPGLAFALSALLVVLTLNAAPGQGIETTYWQAGLLTYLPPLILTATGVALSLRWRSPWPAGLLAFAAGGFNETFTVTEGAALALAVLLAPRPYRLTAAVALAGAVAAGAIMLASPGNASRHAFAGSSWTAVPGLTLRLSWRFARDLMLSPAGWMPVGVGAVLARLMGLQRWWSAWRVGAVVVLLLLAAVAPSAYGAGMVVDRAAMLPALLLVVGAFAVGVSLGSWVAPEAGRHAFIVVLVVVSLMTTMQTYRLLQPMRVYAEGWSFQDQALLAAAANRPASTWTVPRVANPYPGVWQAENDPSWPVNRCLASYYGMAAVRTGH